MFVNLTAFHDERHGTEDGDIFERIAGNQQEVGPLTDGAYVLTVRVTDGERLVARGWVIRVVVDRAAFLRGAGA